MRLAMVGCGNVAGFHVPAMRAVGFDIVSVAGTVNSVRAQAFAKEHRINNCFSDPAALLQNSSEWDALLLTTPVSVTTDYIRSVAPIGKPILVEKPVALDHRELGPLLEFKNVLVAYNRRFYASVQYSKEFVDSHNNVFLKVSIPEQRKDPEHNKDYPERLPIMSYENSVHLYDLMNYLAGKVKWSAVSTISETDKYLAVIALGESDRGITVQLDTCFNSPDNFAINIISDDQRVEMRPIEVARYYRGMNINEPTTDTPIRTYVPNMIEQIVSKEENGLKPGLFGQAKDFMAFCEGRRNYQGADLVDAYQALEVAHSLI